MVKKIEVFYAETTNDNERLKDVAEILSEGVYAHLKKNGFLKDNSRKVNSQTMSGDKEYLLEKCHEKEECS